MSRARPLAVGLAVGLGVLAGAICLGIALAGDPAPAVDPVASAVAAGRHERIEGPRGPIHVFIPRGYHADTGATIVYVHGYWDSADSAWTGHRLAEQFALSAVNAIFIAPEAPSTRGVPVNYPDLMEVIRIVEDKTGEVRGAALTVAIGHSGAYRTLETWFDEPLLDQVILVDALYGDEDRIVRWFEASPAHRLITIGEDTVLGTEAVADKIPGTLTLDQFPPTYELMPAAARTARHLYIRAQYAHMQLVNAGVALPSVLRLLPVEVLGDGPWQAPLGTLPPLMDAGGDAK